MKKFIFTSFVSLMAVAAMAQKTPATNSPADGFYRVQNVGTSRYAYLTDNKGSIDYNACTADLGALSLFLDADARYSDPASVLYVRNTGIENKIDIECQGTSLYSIIGKYARAYQRTNDGNYYVYANWTDAVHYLADCETDNTKEEGKMGDTRASVYRHWNLTPVDAATDEYFGIKPTISAGGKYYYPLSASFAFSFASTGMKAYYVSDINAKTGQICLSEYKGTVMPAGEPFIIECSSMNPSDNRLNVLAEGGVAPEKNYLRRNYFFDPDRDNMKTFRPAYMRVLGTTKGGKLGFVSESDELETYVGGAKAAKAAEATLYLPSNQGYLCTFEPDEEEPATEEEAEAVEPIIAVETEIEAVPAAEFVPDPDKETGITTISVAAAPAAAYSLTGVKMNASELSAGMYVIGGQKVSVR